MSFSHFPSVSRLTNFTYYLLLIPSLVWVLPLGVAAGKEKEELQHGGVGYRHGQPVPVSCLNRTIDSGEHITDPHGKLQYIPFPTCNETFLPLALHYGVSETITCTIASLPDTLYHLLEYYVHSDVPLTCRVPTGPLAPSTGSSGASSSEKKEKEQKDDDDTDEDGEATKSVVSVIDDDGPSYTPLTIALQGTLQRSHLHIWTDMNVLVHKISSVIPSSNKNKRRKAKTAPGYVVAGTAYSVPEIDFLPGDDNKKDNKKEKMTTKEKEAALVEAARNPWAPGHGTKVIRGEPLTFTFRVSWVEGGEGVGWTVSSSSSSSSGTGSGAGAFFGKLIFLAMAASAGAVAALYWERGGGRRRGGWKGDGILGAAPSGLGHARGPSGVTYGDGGRINGYGGFAAGNGVSSMGSGGYGYGYPSGKRD